MEWPKFNDNMKQFVKSQREVIIRSLSGRGQYHLCPEFSHCGVSTQLWMKMRPTQREEIVMEFHKTPVKASYCQSGRNPGTSSSSASADKSLNTMSISAEDTGITTIPLINLQGM